MNLNISKNEILEKLKSVEDPELGVNIVDLGLIYNIEVQAGATIFVEMTFTTPFCPYGSSLQSQVNEVLNEIENVKTVDVKVVFDPAWDKTMISDEAKIELGLL